MTSMRLQCDLHSFVLTGNDHFVRESVNVDAVKSIVYASSDQQIRWWNLSHGSTCS